MRELGVFVIIYNIDFLIEKQITLLKQYINIDFDLIYFDNSSNEEISNNIKIICEKKSIEYIKLNCSLTSHPSSENHGNAMNFVYKEYSNKYKKILFVDHDAFPYDYIDISIYDKYKFSGIKQGKNGYVYLSPVILMINNELYFNKSDINFMICTDKYLDTGGKMYKIIDEEYENVLFLDEKHVMNKYFNKSFHNFYCIIENKWIHFLNSSNWKGNSYENERIASLLNIIDEIKK